MPFEDLNRNGLLALALTPEWVDQDEAAADYTGAPSSADAGVYLQGSPRCVIYVALREDVGRRTARVTITHHASTTYTVTIAGAAAAGASGASKAAALADLVTKVNALSTVTAVQDPDDADYVLITGDDDTDWSLALSVSGGTGTMSATVDASSATVRFFATPGGIIKTGSTGNANGWVQPPNASWGITWRGFMERADCAGFDRGYLELDNIAGNAGDSAGSSTTITYRVQRVMIGPAVLEATT